MPKPPPAAELPITEDDAFIAKALESASVPTLLVSLVHLMGDRSILDGDIRPGPATMGEAQGSLSQEQQERARALALEVLRAYRDGGCVLPPPPAPELIREMMGFMVGEPVPDEYVPMMVEEMALDGRDTRDVRFDDVPAERRSAFPVLVIGAGMSGLLTAIRLEEAGIPYRVVERSDAVGGTWHHNRYPGARVDVGNHFYCYSFEPNHDWSEYFSQQPELERYFQHCASKYGVGRRIRFRTEVVRARFDEEAGDWVVTLRGPGGAEEVERYAAVISAVGQLNRPKLPEIPGLAGFAGKAFHSAEWPDDVVIEGRRVAVVGSGASAMQLVPELAEVASHLTVLQRSPGWMLPNPAYHRKVSEGAKWLMKHVPFYARWYRFLIFWPGSDGLLPALIVDPEWPHQERSVNAVNEATRLHLTAYMESQVKDPELLAKVVPTYPPFGKRILQDNGRWLGALQRENVELVTDGIRSIEADAIVTDDGRRHEVDVIVFATGFHANRFLWPIEVTGKNGVELGPMWGDDPGAYLGITVPGFPNLFCLYGPATNLAHAGSIIFHSECQVRYILGGLKLLLERGQRTMEVRREVFEAYDARLQAALEKTVWAHPGMDSWYKNSRGRVTTTSPWRLVDYRKWTLAPDPADYDFA